jgi:hypothetical protein
MKRFSSIVSILAVLLVVGATVADSASAAGLRRSRNCCDCPSGCAAEPACGAAEPACCAAEPACGAAEPACSAQASCCNAQPRRRGLRSRRAHHQHCTSCCAEPGCAAEPACGAEPCCKAE